MSEFKYIYGESLQHWGKGKEAQNHKYSAREWVKGKWQYIYDTANKAKNRVSDAIGVDERDARNRAQSTYNEDVIKRDKAREAYRNNRYTNEQYYKDVVDRGYDPRLNKRSDAEKAQQELQNAKYIDKELKKEIEDAIGAPKSGADFRYIMSKVHADNSRKERAKNLMDAANRSKANLDAAQSAYDKTLLGKIDKLKNTVKDKAHDTKNNIEDKIGVDEKDRRDKAAKDYFANKRYQDIYKETVDWAHRRVDSGENSLKSYPDDEEYKKFLESANKLAKIADENYDEIHKETDKSRDKYKNAQLEYDKTLLGKVEKGMNLIKKLFNRK